MRPIKFRYLYNGSWHYIDFSTDNTGLCFKEYENRKTHSPLLQFTGLTDRNGKEIYEGDCDREGDYVIFCQECMGWQFAYKWNDEEVCHNCDGDYLFIDSVANFEVTGNIYETKNQSK